MDAKELSAIQSPLKEKYKDNPKAAMLTLHAEGELAEGLGCNVQIGEAQVKQDSTLLPVEKRGPSAPQPFC